MKSGLSIYWDVSLLSQLSSTRRDDIALHCFFLNILLVIHNEIPTDDLQMLLYWIQPCCPGVTSVIVSLYRSHQCVFWVVSDVQLTDFKAEEKNNKKAQLARQGTPNLIKIFFSFCSCVSELWVSCDCVVSEYLCCMLSSVERLYPALVVRQVEAGGGPGHETDTTDLQTLQT